jgi:DeoR/GlpR family transcriptional regulator of sugar metabolism
MNKECIGSNMIAEGRRQEILELIEQHGSIRISNLGKKFNVTDMTIRRDIDHLSELGLVKRVHGGAVSENDGHLNLATTFHKRKGEYKPEKERIGLKAQEYVEENTTIIIDGGSTNELFARNLNRHLRLRVITHALNVAWILSGNENHELFVPGGILNRLTMTFNGPEVEKMYDELNADVLFVAASGVSLEKGLTDPTWLDSSIKKAMIRSSKRVILLIDPHKFDLVSSRTYASIDQVDNIITDRSISKKILQKYRTADINVILA